MWRLDLVVRGVDDDDGVDDSGKIGELYEMDESM